MTAATGKFGGRKMREGTVVSDSMEKTVVVSVASATRHPLYKKTIRRNRNYIVHDENGDAHKGDRVRIVESAPVSKTKRWRLVEVLRQVDLPAVAPEDIDLELIGEAKPKEESPVAVAAAPAAVEEAPAAPPAAEAALPAEAETTEEIETPEEVTTAEAPLPEPEAPAAEEAEAAPEAVVAEPTPEKTVADEPATEETATAEAPADEEKAE